MGEKFVKDILPELVKYMIFGSVHLVWLYMLLAGLQPPDALSWIEIGIIAYFGVDVAAATYRTVKNGDETIKRTSPRVKGEDHG